MTELSLVEFVERVRKGESVSRFEVSLTFKWNARNVSALVAVVKKLRAVKKVADLTGADLTWANLTGANLTWANLSEADLTGANLTRATLTEANLTGATLTEANLTEANLTWANLTEIRASVGFAFALPCGVSLAKLLASLKGASPKVKEYLSVQAMARLAWEDKERLPFAYMRDWLACDVPKKMIKRGGST